MAGLVVGTLTVAMLLLLAVIMLLTTVLRPSVDDGCGSGVTEVSQTQLGEGTAEDLTGAQRNNAQTVIDEGRRRGAPDGAIVIALAVASQESGFRNYANDGLGGDLIFSQQGIERSLRLPHEAVGTDHGSLGVFQQQWPWWGTMRDLMNPAKASGKFYDSLMQVSGWDTMPVTVAAQRVQRSAYPDAYADD